MSVPPGVGWTFLSVRVRLTAHFLDALLPSDGLARALAGTGVGAGALAAQRHAAAVADASVTANVLQAGDVLLDLPAERAFDRVFAVEDGRQPGQVVVGQLLGPPLRVDLGLLAQPQRRGRPDAVDIAQRDVRRLVVRDVHTQDTWHSSAPRPTPAAACAAGCCKSRTAGP